MEVNNRSKPSEQDLPAPPGAMTRSDARKPLV